MRTLDEHEWKPLSAAHEKRVTPWIRPRLERMSRQEKHPIDDFLFEYYSHRPGQLAKWHPGIGTAIRGESAGEYLIHKGYRETPHGITASALPPNRVTAIQWIRAMLSLSENRTPSFRCFGLHEWAMVYRSDTIRHEAWPLRLSPEEIARTIDSSSVYCTHYDAFRFFTDAARPLNRVQPERQTAAAFEQPGCLHANMDLYKWSYKLAPFTPSELVADAFELARSIRVLDMQASPYDFSALGLEPVRIETPEGRTEYEERQREFSRLSAPIRRRLISLCDLILSASERTSESAIPLTV